MESLKKHFESLTQDGYKTKSMYTSIKLTFFLDSHSRSIEYYKMKTKSPTTSTWTPSVLSMRSLCFTFHVFTSNQVSYAETQESR